MLGFRSVVRASRMAAARGVVRPQMAANWARPMSTGDEKVPITVAHGDGIGPEVMDATLRILEAAEARIAPETIEVGEKVYLSGNSTGIPQDAWDSLRRTSVFLKAPITTPQGGGYKSLNVTMRKTLGLYANVRPCHSYTPYVESKHPNMDLVLIRENEEDTYAGIEHRQTQEVYQCLKLISRSGCEKIVRYAFEYARRHGRQRVTAFVKDNIMKMTDGIFSKVFMEIGEEYPEIEQERIIVDIGTALLADTPERFDVLVMPNLYGDIASDVAAQISGSVGLGGSANIGDKVAMFEAIHGSAPDIAGKNMANPSGLLLGAVQMLAHIDQPDVAETVYNAWLRTIEDGRHTGDIYSIHSTEKLGTAEFADAIIERLGDLPKRLPKARFQKGQSEVLPVKPRPPAPEELKEDHGVDVFVDWTGTDANQLAATVQAATKDDEELELRGITSRGVKVWPDGNSDTATVDHWTCRFRPKKDGRSSDPSTVSRDAKMRVTQSVHAAGLDVIKTENLYLFNGKPGFSLGQGE